MVPPDNSITPEESDRILAGAISAARLAQQCILSETTDRSANHKSIAEMVTRTDIESQRRIVCFLRDAFPNHNILAEESDERHRMDVPNLWIVDPLDGTNNYANGIPQYAVSIAYAENGIVTHGVVLDPLRNELFSARSGKGSLLNDTPIFVTEKNLLNDAIVATGFSYDRGPTMIRTLESIRLLFETGIRGIRRFGSAALDLCWVACGRFDAYFEYHLQPWDFAAGELIVREAGGIITDQYGFDLTIRSDGAIAAPPILHSTLLPLIRYPDRSAPYR